MACSSIPKFDNDRDITFMFKVEWIIDTHEIVVKEDYERLTEYILSICPKYSMYNLSWTSLGPQLIFFLQGSFSLSDFSCVQVCDQRYRRHFTLKRLPMLPIFIWISPFASIPRMRIVKWAAAFRILIATTCVLIPLIRNNYKRVIKCQVETILPRSISNLNRL